MKKTLFIVLTALLLSGYVISPPVGATPPPEPQMAQREVSDAELDSILAPIALYPDTVLTHILIASTYPLEVLNAYRWRKDNAHLSAEEVTEEVEVFDWDPSVRALAPLTQVLETMSDDLDWLQDLGDNVLIDQSRVLARVQVLRQHALNTGHLKNSDYLTYEKEEEVIVIEPRRREVVYIPYYDTRVVYGNWWHPIAPVYWHHPVHAVSHASFYWSPSFRLSTHFYFGGIHWHDRHVVFSHAPVRYYHRPRNTRHVYSKGFQRWNHNADHRRSRYSPRVINRVHSLQEGNQIQSKPNYQQRNIQHRALNDELKQVRNLPRNKVIDKRDLRSAHPRDVQREKRDVAPVRRSELAKPERPVLDKKEYMQRERHVSRRPKVERRELHRQHADPRHVEIKRDTVSTVSRDRTSVKDLTQRNELPRREQREAHRSRDRERN
ncbi:DUF3300 domain-containing protein [Alteromonas sp. ASW11-130]|uniref:DUF3300 domain-containing protein n=1 Tax=Alteromonas sp. ASW11-130 TaxID=3015775 RepID=UPI002241CC15|nr:DUF3300 domain-containing protein [Alteromonas sp. ASW11-130]MCW8091083.1 DUF3300 domain-containing protein [Alteromonas sp. ASW11-130]